MRLVNISEALGGMVIAKDIFNSYGQCLVSKGTILTRALIDSLIRHNIIKLPIEDELGKENFTDEEIMDAERICLKKVSKRFYAELDDAMMKTIFKTALKIEAIEYLECQKKN